MFARELLRFLRVLRRRVPAKVGNLIRLANGKPSYGFPPDDFDQRTGLDTSGIVKIYNLDSVNGNSIHGQGYQPVHPSAFVEALQEIAADFSRYTFVDLGCGKGRALLFSRRRSSD